MRPVYAVRAALWQMPREATADEIRAAVERALAGEPAEPSGPPMPADLPPGHPLPWDELVPYERQQGGYWLYERGRVDVYGNGKRFVPVSKSTTENGA